MIYVQVCVVATGPELRAITNWSAEAQSTPALLEAFRSVRPGPALDLQHWTAALRVCVEEIARSVEPRTTEPTRRRLVLLLQHQQDVPLHQ